MSGIFQRMSMIFRAKADKETEDKPGYPESVAMLVQIGDHLSKHYDVKG